MSIENKKKHVIVCFITRNKKHKCQIVLKFIIRNRYQVHVNRFSLIS